jgi:hypothetical protein
MALSVRLLFKYHVHSKFGRYKLRRFVTEPDQINAREEVFARTQNGTRHRNMHFVDQPFFQKLPDGMSAPIMEGDQGKQYSVRMSWKSSSP